MASYQERLGQFNQALNATNEHIDNIKNAVRNPEISENPVKLGLEVAGQVSGTVGGITGLVSRVRDGNVVRNVQKAFYNKLGQVVQGQKNTTQGIGDALQGVSGDVQSQVSQGLNNFKVAGQSLGAQVADTGKTASNSIQNIQSTASNLTQSTIGDAERNAVDGGINSRISNLSGGTNQLSDVQDIDKAINQKVNANLDSGGRQALNNATPDVFAQRVNQINNMDDSNPLKAVGQQRLLQAKNNMANDAIARSKAGQPPADAYDGMGNAQLKPTTSAPAQVASNPVASGDTGGVASTGTNASTSVAQAPATQVMADANLPHGGTASIGTAADASKVVNPSGDILSAGNLPGVASADAGQGIAQRANSLMLKLGQVPTQSGQGTIQGLTSASTAQNPSAQSHMVTQAQGADASQHAAAQAPGNQTSNNSLPSNTANNADNAAKTAGTDASNLSGNASASAGANSAEDAGSGIKTALGVESTLDELAPDTGPLAPILEAGSLLATIGTGIASLFEPGEKKKTPPPAPAPQSVSVGANLKSNASQAVGAF